MTEVGIVIILFVLCILVIGLWLSASIKKERVKWNLMMKDYHEKMDDSRRRAFHRAEKQSTPFGEY